MDNQDFIPQGKTAGQYIAKIGDVIVHGFSLILAIPTSPLIDGFLGSNVTLKERMAHDWSQLRNTDPISEREDITRGMQKFFEHHFGDVSNLRTEFSRSHNTPPHYGLATATSKVSINLDESRNLLEATISKRPDYADHWKDVEEIGYPDPVRKNILSGIATEAYSKEVGNIYRILDGSTVFEATSKNAGEVRSAAQQRMNYLLEHKHELRRALGSIKDMIEGTVSPEHVVGAVIEKGDAYYLGTEGADKILAERAARQAEKDGYGSKHRDQIINRDAVKIEQQTAQIGSRL